MLVLYDARAHSNIIIIIIIIIYTVVLCIIYMAVC